jgi:anti-anti-sigma factor
MDPVPFEAAFDARTAMLMLSGEIDDEAMLDLHRALDEATDEGRRPVLVDLSAITYLPSAALGLLSVTMRRGRKSGHRVRLQAPGDGFVGSLLKLSGLEFHAL